MTDGNFLGVPRPDGVAVRARVRAAMSRCRTQPAARTPNAWTLRAVATGADGVREHAYVHRSQVFLRAPEAS